MKTLVMLSIFVASALYGIEYSLRIQALGTDFAYLVPDYETDLYLDPNILGERRITGIEWDQNIALLARTPFVVRVVTKRFAWSGQYWGAYQYEHDRDGHLYTAWNMHLQDVWMLDLRGKLWKFLTDDVWNLYNGLHYSYWSYCQDVENYHKMTEIEYFPGMNGSIKVGSHVKILTSTRAGLYRKKDLEIDRNMVITNSDMWCIPLSMRAGLQYRNMKNPTDFTTFCIFVGGPTSVQEIDDLPYSIWTGMGGNEIRMSYFVQALSAQTGIARGIDINGHGMFVIGLRDEFLVQFAEDHTPPFDEKMRALENKVILPMGLEYNFDRLSLRFGAYVRYASRDYTTWDYDFPDNVIQRTLEHNLQVGRSFGVQWKVTDKFIIELHNSSSLAELVLWKIYIKYESM